MTNRLGFLVLATLAAAMSAGCGYGPSDYCDDMCECNGCSDRDHQDCLDGAEEIERRADRDGCNDQLSDLESCYEDTGYCARNDHWNTDCGPEQDRLMRCMAYH